MKFPDKLIQKLNDRKQQNALRQLPAANNRTDFSSNDYLGFAQSETIFKQTHQFLIDHNFKTNGATGSRLISGNHPLYSQTEDYISKFHETDAALIFNSGYDANVGFFSAVPQKGDFILYDELCHASIRDGIQLSNAKSYKFQHNDFDDLERLILKFKSEESEIYIATESVFSMDGDAPNLETLLVISEKYNSRLVIDEAHALGVFGKNGAGLVQELQLQNKIFARIMTFGKGLGCHGAAILGSEDLKNYLVNFARSFIYSTGLSPHAIATILIGYQNLETQQSTIEKLRDNIITFGQHKNMLSLKPIFVYSKSAIQCAIIPGNDIVKLIAGALQQQGFDVKPILSPTVPEGQERLRICLHSYNSETEIKEILELMRTFVIA